jgi:hypothetical protein
MKYLDFFTQGECQTNSVEDFLKSSVGEYLQKIYGEFLYISSEKLPFNKHINFIGVYKIRHQINIVDEILMEYTSPMLNAFCIGLLFPAKYIDLTAELEPRESTILSHDTRTVDLNALGFCCFHKYHSNEMLSKLRSRKWEKLPSSVFDSNNNYDVVREYMANPNGTLPFLEDQNTLFISRSRKIFQNNTLIEKCIDRAQTRAQRMMNGTSLVPHFDADIGEPYLFSGLTWYVDSPSFEGRELVVGRRSDKDLAKFIDNFVNNKYHEVHQNSISEMKVIAKFNPDPDIMVMVNTANPIFFHAVTEMKGEGAIYTIINDCKMHPGESDEHISDAD